VREVGIATRVFSYGGLHVDEQEAPLRSDPPDRRLRLLLHVDQALGGGARIKANPADHLLALRTP
jgi:hypothetical protein